MYNFTSLNLNLKFESLTFDIVLVAILTLK